jgi:hypothetical protein
LSTRLHCILNRLWAAVFFLPVVLLAVYFGSLLGARRWPYEVKQTIVYTADVPPGGVFRMARVINYQDDCALHYDRRLQSLEPDTKGALRRDVLPDIDFSRPPFELDNKLQSQAITIPDDFPCGKAVLVDSPTASCNWFQRIFWPQHRKDAITSFNVACQHAGDGK